MTKGRGPTETERRAEKRRRKDKARGRNYRLRFPLRAVLLKHARRRSEQAQVKFSLTEADFIDGLPTHCPVFPEIKLVYGGNGTGRQGDDSATLDRVDNALGYVPGNVLVISWKANKLKGDGTVEDHRRIAEFFSLGGGGSANAIIQAVKRWH